MSLKLNIDMDKTNYMEIKLRHRLGLKPNSYFYFCSKAPYFISSKHTNEVFSKSSFCSKAQYFLTGKHRNQVFFVFIKDLHNHPPTRRLKSISDLFEII